MLTFDNNNISQGNPQRQQLLSLTVSSRNLIPLTGVAGFEPTHEGVKVPCLTAWLYPKNNVQPKTFLRMEGEGFEPPNPKERIYSPPRLASSLPFRYNKNYSNIVFVLLQVLFGFCMW